MVGILICRSIEKPKILQQRCKDTANDQRGFILTLSDDEIIELVNEARDDALTDSYSLLMNKFRKLVD